MALLLSLFSNNLLPVLLMAATGYALGHWLKVNPRDISRAVFFIFSPSLVFTLLTHSALTGGEIFQMMGFAGSHIATIAIIAGIVVWVLRFDRRIALAIVLTATIPNAGNYGMSTTKFAFGESALAFASLYYVTSAIMVNSLGVFIAALGGKKIKDAALELLRIPGLYATVIALLVNSLGWTTPEPLDRAISTLGGAAIPGMLVMLGLQLQRAKWTGHNLALGTSTLLRMVASVGIGLVFARVFNLQGAAFQAGVLESGMPTAVMTTVLATEYDIEPVFVTQVVFITTLLSPFTLTPLMAWLGAGP